MLTYPFHNRRAVAFTACFYAAYLLLLFWLAMLFFKWDGTTIMALMLAPYVLMIDTSRRSARYFFPAVGALVLAILMPVHTMLYMSLVLSGLFLIENCLGKTNRSILWLAALASPVFGDVSRLFEFPVRLWLTARVVDLVNATGRHASAAGNLIAIDKYEFSVDTACAGLNMLATSLLITLMLLAFYKRREQRQLSLGWSAAVMVLTIVLNVACNFFRIWFIVTLKIMPGTLMHDITGIVCLAVYVIIPMIVGIKYFYRRLGKTQEPAPATFNGSLHFAQIHLLLLAGNIFGAMHLKKLDELCNLSNSPITVNGYHKSTLHNGVIKFDNPKTLIYIKPTAFYAPEHDPMVCWTGSGYEFKAIQESVVQGRHIYSGMLQKAGGTIYTAWWFDNGQTKTVNQLKWRWQAATGQPGFCLINVNAAKRDDLTATVNRIINQNLIH